MSFEFLIEDMGKKKILILGSLGMLGQELAKSFSYDKKYEVTAWDKDDIDVTDFIVMEKELLALKPEIVINATGYNAVDLCEKDDEEFRKALILNRDVPSFLAEMSAKYGFLLVHYSTDYVFDGALGKNLSEKGCCGGGCCQIASDESEAKIGYNEEALPHPISRYGESKLFGEKRVQENAENYFLVRLSKLFGRPGSSAAAKRSFFEVILEAAKSRERVEVVDEERSSFTYAPDLAKATKELIESDAKRGIYHLTNSGSVTWYEATRLLFDFAHVTTPLVPISSEKLSRPAQRPACSTLINSKRPALRPFEEALKEYLRQ